MQDSMRVTANVPLALKAANILRKRIQEEFKAGGRIPGEVELAMQLGVNRGTVRQALHLLEQEGLIIRRHGSGTFVNRHVLGIKMRLETVQRFTELIRNAGYEPKVVPISVTEEAATEDAAQRLALAPDTTLLVMRELILADEQPAIYVIDAIPATLPKEPYDTSELHESIFGFLERRCYTRISYGMSEVVPCLCGEELARVFELEPPTALLQLNTTYYNKSNDPIMASISYYKDPIVRFSIMRKVI